MKYDYMEVVTFLKNNKIFFDTIAVVLLSIMAIIISIVQTKIFAKQTALIDIQTNLSKIETDEKHKEITIAKAKDWVALRDSLRLVIEKFPNGEPFQSTDTASLNRDLASLFQSSTEDKLKWLSEMEPLVSVLGSNPVLISSRPNYERFLAMLGDIQLARDALDIPINDRSQHFFCVSVERLRQHAERMWWVLGMLQTSRPTDDALFEPSTPEEDIFTKGFPWEKEIRKK